jgi:hypothetical protein
MDITPQAIEAQVVETTEVDSSNVVSLRRCRGPELADLDSVRREMSRVYRECRRKKIRPEDGSRFVFMLGQIAKVLEVVQIERRLDALEHAHTHESE